MTTACEQGMVLLNQDPKWGKVAAVLKPSTVDEAVELHRKMTISTGEFWEFFGYPIHEELELLKALKEMITQ